MLESEVEGAASYLADRVFGRRRIGHLRHGQALRAVEYTRREGRLVRDSVTVDQMMNRRGAVVSREWVSEVETAK